MISSRDFGWWLESTDEEILGPVTKPALQKFLRDGVISPNTLVRHCTEAQFGPVADKGIFAEGDLTPVLRTGDKLSDRWYAFTSMERAAHSESGVECAYHRRPAIQTCIRCRAPYCRKCSMKKGRKPFYMCKRCQANIFNRRFAGYFIDGFIFNMVPAIVGVPLLLAAPQSTVVAGLYQIISWGGSLVFIFRDAVLKGAGPAKRMMGLRVVNMKPNGGTVTYWQGFIRSLAHLIPLFNLIDAGRPYQDPGQQRYGDRWAKTKVIDTKSALDKARRKAAARLARKGIAFEAEPVMKMSDFVHVDG